MNSFQRIIKYCAIAFAIILAVGIISGIASVVFGVVTVVSGGVRYNHDGNDNRINFSQDFTNVKSLDIENSTGSLYIKTGDTFRVEAENVTEGFQAKVSGNGKLTVNESSHGIQFFWFNINNFNNPNSKITVYLPEGFVAENAKIDTGAGKVTIDALAADSLVISAGAGNITGDKLTAEDVSIDGGVGSVSLSNVNFKDADFNCGVGNLKVDGVLLGKNKVDSGVGEVDLELIGNEKDYDFNIDSGIGSIRIDGKKISEGYKTHNDADNSLEIDGGVGNVRIDFTQQSNGF